LVCGGVAGLAVDVSLYPIDTVKTRLQSGNFWKSGGFRGVYRGLSAAAAGSVPGAALFFGVYESSKAQLPDTLVFSYMLAASAGEIAACCIRVPVEVVKQRLQAGQYPNLRYGAAHVWRTEGISGFFRGYGMTVLREIPFAMIQFPLLEKTKSFLSDIYLKRKLSPFEVAACGSLCGGFAAFATTPLDVVKTRLMLANSSQSITNCVASIYKKEGAASFFAGASARVFWISLGGFVFFGAYDFSTSLFPF